MPCTSFVCCGIDPRQVLAVKKHLLKNVCVSVGFVSFTMYVESFQCIFSSSCASCRWWSASICRLCICPLTVFLCRQWLADDISHLPCPLASLSLGRTLDWGFQKTLRWLRTRFGTVCWLVSLQTFGRRLKRYLFTCSASEVLFALYELYSHFNYCYYFSAAGYSIADLIIRKLFKCVCVCLLTRVSAIITAWYRDL